MVSLSGLVEWNLGEISGFAFLGERSRCSCCIGMRREVEAYWMKWTLWGKHRTPESDLK